MARDSIPEPFSHTKISPPAWGWPGSVAHQERLRHDFPTRVGMARHHAHVRAPDRGFPHPRGDGPPPTSPSSQAHSISPPAWGWPVTTARLLPLQPDFPTRVGMARPAHRRCKPPRGFPHPRGDGPPWCDIDGEPALISPPAWGWPGPAWRADHPRGDFPTRVGMARLSASDDAACYGFPHPRGDGPQYQESGGGDGAISPPAWGWPEVGTEHMIAGRDFPTRVGMARSRKPIISEGKRFPHPRGDGPAPQETMPTSSRISPPAWGWPGELPPNVEL